MIDSSRYSLRWVGLTLLLVLSGCGGTSSEDDSVTHITRSETYASQGQYRSAILEVKNAIQQDPTNVEYVTRLGELFLDIGAYRDAAQLLSPWMAEHSNAVSLPLAEAYTGQQKHLSALETLAKAAPTSAEEKTRAALLKGEALRLSGDYTGALSVFSDIAEENPGNAEAVAGSIKTYLNLNNTTQAIALADQAIVRETINAEVLLLKGLAQYQANRIEPAIETLTEAVSALPPSDIFLPQRRQTLTFLSKALTEQGRITEAQIYNKVLEENTDSDMEQQAQAAVRAIQEGRFEEASATLNDLLALNPDNERVALTLGALNLQQGKLDEGLNLLEENIDPETSPTRYIRLTTMARIDKGERQQALDTLSRAVEARPDDPELLAMHGLVALSLEGSKTEGVTSLSRAIALKPDNVRLRLALARYYVSENLPEQALGQMRVAFATNPADWPTTSAYVSLLIAQNQDSELAELRESLDNGYPEQTPARLLSAIARAALGEREQAIASLESLNKDAPENLQVNRVLSALYLQTGQPAKAISTLLAAASQQQERLPTMMLAARIYNRVNEAQGAFLDWTKKIPSDYPALGNEAHALRILWYIDNGQLVEARRSLKTASEPTSPSIQRAEALLLVAEARELANSGQWEKALNSARQAVALAPDDLTIRLVPVQVRILEGNTDQASALLDTIEEQHGARLPVIESRAAIMEARGDKAGALRYLEQQWAASGQTGLMPNLLRLASELEPGKMADFTRQWVEASPTSAAANLARANALLAQQDEVGAVAHYERVLEQDQNHLTALNNLAWALRDANTARALELASRAVELAPENPNVRDTYGWLLHLNGEHTLALNHIEKALSQAPDNEEIRQHRDAVRSAQ